MANDMIQISASRLRKMEKQWANTANNQRAAIERLQAQLEEIAGYGFMLAILLDRMGTWSETDEVVVTLKRSEFEAANPDNYKMEPVEADNPYGDWNVIRKGQKDEW